MRLFIIGYLAILVILISGGCNPDSGDGEFPENPVPSLFSISPTSKVTHLPSFTLTAYGDNFVSGAVIVFNGRDMPTTYVNEGVVNCQLDVDINVVTGDSTMSVDKVVSVRVRNPGFGNKISSSLDFTIFRNHAFTMMAELDFGDYNYYRPNLVVDKPGSIHLVYGYFESGDQSAPVGGVYCHSEDGGETWTSPKTFVTGSTGLISPSIAVDGNGTIYIIFNAGDVLYVLRSPDGGITWSDPVVLPGRGYRYTSAKLEIDSSGGLNTVWTRPFKRRYFSVFHSRSVDGGESWTEPINLFNGWDDSISAFAVGLVTDNIGGIFVTWTAMPESGSKTGYGSVFANYSRNYGVSWNYTDTSFGKSLFSDIAIDHSGGGGIYVAVGKTFSQTEDRIVLLESRDRGISWNREEIVTDGGSAERPGMVIDRAGNINLVYLSYPGPSLHFIRSVDRGSNWSMPQQMFQDAAEAGLTVDHLGNLYFVCGDIENTRLYFQRSVY